MVHVGRPYPIKQEWRMYNGETFDLSGFPPKQIKLSVESFISTIGTIEGFFQKVCDPVLWEPGQDYIGYHSESVIYFPYELQFGTIGKLGSNGRMRWKYSVWVNGTDVIPWGWEESPNQWQWNPGDTRLILSTPPGPPSVYPHGVVDLGATQWP
jgi:hypothetical protein